MVTKFTRFRLVFDRKNQVNPKDKDSTGIIEIEMSLNGQRKLSTTHFKVTSDQWNKKKAVPKDATILRNIQLMISEYQNFESEFRAVHKSFKLNDFKRKGETIQEPAPKNISFTDFYKEQLEAERPLNQASFRNRLKTYEYFKKFKDQVRFDELNYSLIKSFDLFLHSGKASGCKLHLNTINKHHKNLRKNVLEAIKNRYIIGLDNPYNDFKPSSQPYESNYLTWEELQRFEDLQFTAKESLLERCRDMFLMASYTGLRYMDVYKIRPSHILETSEGLELDFQANKTKKFGQKFLYLLFDGKPQILAKKYIEKSVNDNPLFKGLTNPKVNKALKIIAKMAGVHKATKFKDSRNTFANYLLTKVPMNVVQDEMQHSNLSTTQGYLKNNPELKKQALSKINWK